MSATEKLADALLGHIKVWKMGPGGIVIEIDSHNPDTPALVWSSIKRRHSSTYECAMSESCIDDVRALSGVELQWLWSFEKQVDAAFEIARRDLPQYR